jgi:hypothetical protein
MFPKASLAFSFPCALVTAIRSGGGAKRLVGIVDDGFRAHTRNILPCLVDRLGCLAINFDVGRGNDNIPILVRGTAFLFSSGGRFLVQYQIFCPCTHPETFSSTPTILSTFLCTCFGMIMLQTHTSWKNSKLHYSQNSGPHVIAKVNSVGTRRYIPRHSKYIA